MSKNTEHTPTPWKLHTDSQLAITGEGRFIASLNHTHMRSSPVCPKEGEQDANAKLIVKAVNSHDALKGVVRTLIERWESIPEDQLVPEELNDTDEWNWDIARAALALAEGETT